MRSLNIIGSNPALRIGVYIRRSRNHPKDQTWWDISVGIETRSANPPIGRGKKCFSFP
jgi:hypothetical protein